MPCSSQIESISNSHNTQIHLLSDQIDSMYLSKMFTHHSTLRRSVVLLLILLSSAASQAQNYIAYHNKCNAACPLIDDGHYKEAKQLLLAAMRLVDVPLPVDLFNLAKCYSQLAEKDSTLLYLEAALTQDFRAASALDGHTLWFKPILGLEKWNEILEADYLVEIEFSEAEISMYKRINRLDSIDRHFIKISSDSIEVYHPIDTTLQNLYSDSVVINGALVITELHQIIKEFGWPGTKRYTTVADPAFIIHLSDEAFRNLKATLTLGIDVGNLPPWSYVDIADRVRRRNGLKPMYNGYFATEEEPTAQIELNCKTIGAPLGRVRKIRCYFRY
jgi:hypothetical protein